MTLSYLVITVCLSGRISRRTFRIWGSNPISNIRSASSRTKYVTDVTSIIPVKWYNNEQLALLHLSSPPLPAPRAYVAHKSMWQVTFDITHHKHRHMIKVLHYRYFKHWSTLFCSAQLHCHKAYITFHKN